MENNEVVYNLKESSFNEIIELLKKIKTIDVKYNESHIIMANEAIASCIKNAEKIDKILSSLRYYVSIIG